METGAHQHQTITAPHPGKKNLIAGRDGEGWGIGLVEDGGGGVGGEEDSGMNWKSRIERYAIQYIK